MAWDGPQIRRIVLILLVLAQPAAGIAFGIGPPKINGALVYAMTVVVEFLAVIAYGWSSRSRRTLIVVLCGLLAAILIYIGVYSTQVIDGAEKAVKGFRYSDAAIRIQEGRASRKQPPLSDEDLIRKYREEVFPGKAVSTQQVIDQLWSGPSIMLAVAILTFAWISSFALLAPAIQELMARAWSDDEASSRNALSEADVAPPSDPGRDSRNALDLGALRDELVAQFDSREDLAILVSDALDGWNLDQIASDKLNLVATAFELLKWADKDRVARLKPLLDEAVAKRPNNSRLKRMRDSLGD